MGAIRIEDYEGYLRKICIVLFRHLFGGGNPIHGMEWDDILQAAREGFVIANKTYQPEKASFDTYLYMCVKRSVIEELRRCYWFKRSVSGAVIETGLTGVTMSEGTSPDVLEVVEALELLEELRFTENQEIAFRCYYLEGKNPSEFAGEIGCKVGTTWNHMKNARDKVKRCFH